MIHRCSVFHHASSRADQRVAGPGDSYNPVDPDSLPDRLAAAGFERIEVRTNPYGWAVVAHRG
ncbi:MAG: hypothetical protein QOI25_3622 [Mycobacterium sp.]|nr:hypothetical protein [Mycobacterium sp.]